MSPTSHPPIAGVAGQPYAVLVADVVESVRLVTENGGAFITLWTAFVREVRDRIVPQHGGEVVKHLGDGMLLLFGSVDEAVRAGRDLLRWLGDQQAAAEPASVLHLRVGIDFGVLVRNEIDVFGPAANMAARLAAAAAPDELMLSAAARAASGPEADALVEDVGECYFKHLSQSVHCYRIVQVARPAVARPPSEAGRDLLVPRIAVLPPSRKGIGRVHAHGADLIADSIIAQLSSSPSLRVISRLSTAAAARRRLTVPQLAELLGVTYVLSGSITSAGDRWHCWLELSDGRRGEVIWCRGTTIDPRDLLLTDDPFGVEVAGHVFAAIQAHQLRRFRAFPLPSLEAYSLQFSALALMHRAPLQDFNDAQRVLEQLIERHPRAPSPRAWIAKWWVLRTTRGIATRPQDDATQALTHVRAALQTDPDNALAWSMKGFVECHMVRDLDAADASLNHAITTNRNEPLAWLFRCVVQGFRNEGEAALQSVETALALSPLDPLRHYYDALACSAAINARRYERGIELATRALKWNRAHLPTLRAMTVALAETDRVAEAQRVAQRVMAAAPGFTIGEYLASAPKGSEGTRQRYAEAFAKAGLPA